jgi:CRISPR-associated protein Cas1
VLELQNVLYVMTSGSVLHLDHDTVRVTVDGENRLRAPLGQLSGIVVLGRVTVTSPLIERCATDGRSLVWLDSRGRFSARVEGPTRGNVLLRREQHLALSDPERTYRIARQIVAAKVQNSRRVVLRAAREAAEEFDTIVLGEQAERMATALDRLQDSRTLDEVRGVEGEALACTSTSSTSWCGRTGSTSRWMDAAAVRLGTV